MPATSFAAVGIDALGAPDCVCGGKNMTRQQTRRFWPICDQTAQRTWIFRPQAGFRTVIWVTSVTPKRKAAAQEHR
jgi:hypothetical protein